MNRTVVPIFYIFRGLSENWRNNNKQCNYIYLYKKKTNLTRKFEFDINIKQSKTRI